MWVMKVVIIAEKKLHNPLTRAMYVFCNVAIFRMNHQTAFYCLNDTCIDTPIQKIISPNQIVDTNIELMIYT